MTIRNPDLAASIRQRLLNRSKAGALDFNSRGVLKSLAAETGGEAFFPKSVDELPAVYARIAELLRSQYLIWYASPSSKPFEEFREIFARGTIAWGGEPTKKAD